MATEDRLIVMLEARVSDFEKRIARAERAGSKAFQKIERDADTLRDRLQNSFLGAGKAFTGFAKTLAAPLLALGAAGAVRQIAATANEIARIGDEAQRAGLKAKDFQELKFVAEQNRIGVDALVDGFKELSLRADEFIVTGGGSAAEAFQRLGYSAEELNTKLQTPNELFTEIIGKLQKLDRGAQIRIADELFGGTGGEQFVQLIGQGEEGIRRTIAAAHDLGIVMSDETIAKAAELDRKFNAVATTVSSHLKQAIVEAAGALDDFLNSFGQTPAQAFSQVTEELRTQQQLLTDLGAAGGREFPELKGRLDEILGSISATGEGAVEAKVELLKLASEPDYAPLIGDLNGVIQTLINMTGQANAARQAMQQATKDSLGVEDFTLDDVQNLFKPPTPTTVPGSGSGGRGGGVTEADRQAAAVLRLIDTLEYEQTTIGMTARELAVANALREAGSAATEKQRTRITELVQSNFDAVASQEAMATSMQQLDDLAHSVGQSLADAFADGKLEAGELLDIVLDVIANLARLPSLGGATGGAGGGGNFLGSLISGFFGFSGGGYTGNRGESDVAGVVHGKEYVVNAKATRKWRPVLEAINAGMSGFKAGGYAAPAPVGEGSAEFFLEV